MTVNKAVAWSSVDMVPDWETGPDGRAGAIVALSRMLIEFTYDVIERSRRGGIFEAVSLARHATDDDDVRRRILDYLHEGLGGQYIDELLEKETVDLTAWCALAAKARRLGPGWTPVSSGASASGLWNRSPTIRGCC